MCEARGLCGDRRWWGQASAVAHLIGDGWSPLSHRVGLPHRRILGTELVMRDYGDPGWFQSFELGHQGYSEFLIYWDPDDDTDPVDHFYLETFKMNIRYRFYTSLLGPHQPLYLTGPNYREFLLKVKNEFDPKWRSHPPVPLAHDLFVERAPWMRHMKDRESPDDFME